MKSKFRTFVKVSFTVAVLAQCFGCRLLPFSREKMLQEERERTKRTEEAIQTSPIFGDIDRFCTQVPKPEGFELISKSKSWTERKFLSYGYFSKTPYPQVKAFYTEYFAQNGWELTDDSSGVNSEWVEFQKGDHKISVYYSTRDPGLNYMFTCEKLAE